MTRSKKALFTHFILFNLGGLVFFVLGYGIFVVLYGVIDWPWWLAKLVADAVGWFANYLIQRYGTFREHALGSQERTILAKFSVVSLVNLVLDYGLVWLLKLLGISPYLGLWLSAAFFTGLKYLQYRFYVFRRRTW